MKIPLIYNIRSVTQRPVSTAFTAIGIALVVAVFVAMLALANGFIQSLTETGSDDNILVMRKGADSELSSGVSREMVNTISTFPQIAVGDDGKPLVSPETYLVINIPRVGLDTLAIANVVIRGVSDRAFLVRKNVTVEGKRFASGQAEICVGNKLVPRFKNTAIGDKLHFAGRDWTVTCHFSAAGSSFESEIWGETEQFQNALRGTTSVQSVTFRMKDPAGFEETKRALEGDVRLQVDAHKESAYYAQQSEMIGTVLRILAYFITIIMSFGAIFGAINTMFASVSSRTSEIAVLLTLGFKPRNVMFSFLAESAVIAFIGGVIGCIIVLPINGMVTSTTNFASFSELAFAFQISPKLLGYGMIFAVAMGVIGGFFPARRASKLPVVQALR